MNIYLIGYRCTGKTSVGKLLAARLKWRFVDTDSRLTEKAGMTILQIVSNYGWAKFREKEKEVISGLDPLDRTVIATGGGVVLDPENVAHMKKDTNVVIWLKAKPETIKTRILKDKNTSAFRPALSHGDLDTEIRETLSERDPLYRAAMRFAVETDHLSITETCEHILTELENAYAGKFIWQTV